MFPYASSSELSHPDLQRYGSLQHPMDASYRQSSFLLGLSMAVAGLIFLPGTALIVEKYLARGVTSWAELIFPFMCMLASGLIFVAGLAYTIDARYRQRKMRLSGKTTRAKILGFEEENDAELGTYRYLVYEFDVPPTERKPGRYTLREVISDDLYKQLANREYTLVHYVSAHPNIATVNLRSEA